MRNLRRILALIFVFPLASAYLHGQSTSTSAANPAASLDAKLVAASALSADQPTVQMAVDSIFSAAGFDPTIPDAFSITSQIVTSQLAFNVGNYQALSEANVIAAINYLATTWSLPAHASTTPAEMRQLHTALIQAFPQFMLSDVSVRLGANAAGNPIVRTGFSPLEAVLMFCLMAHQKMSNPQYHMTVDEYIAYHTARHSGGALPVLADRTTAMAVSTQVAVSSAGAFTLLQQANQALTILGVSGVSGGAR